MNWAARSSFGCYFKSLAVPIMLALIMREMSVLAASPIYRVSDNGRFLVDASGEPFFWQGDTEWELFYALTAQDAKELLHERRGQGFTVVQAMCDGMFPKWIPPGRRLPPW